MTEAYDSGYHKIHRHIFDSRRYWQNQKSEVREGLRGDMHVCVCECECVEVQYRGMEI